MDNSSQQKEMPGVFNIIPNFLRGGSSSNDNSLDEPIWVKAKNTFLEVIVDEPAQVMPRTQSWSVSSSTGSSGSCSYQAAYPLQPGHILYDSSSGGGSTDGAADASKALEASKDYASKLRAAAAALASSQKARNESAANCWSVGSESHKSGKCTPCAYLRKGCRNGRDCAFCHVEHPAPKTQLNLRPSKAAREQSKALVEKLQKLQPKEREEQTQQLIAENPYLAKLLGLLEGINSSRSPSAVASSTETSAASLPTKRTQVPLQPGIVNHTSSSNGKCSL